MKKSKVCFITKRIPKDLKEEMTNKILRGSSPGWTYTVSAYDPGGDEDLKGCTFLAETGMGNYYWHGEKKVWLDDCGSRI